LNTTAALYKLQKHGIAAPTQSGAAATAVAGAGAGTNLNGTYTWRVKFRNSRTGAESEAGTLFPVGGLALANDDADLSNLPVSVDPQVDVKRIYRTLAGGAGVWFFVAQIANATTTFTDNVADVNLGAQMREFLDNVIPDAVGVAALWPQANRLIGINRSTGAVVFSDQPNLEDGTLKPESWPVDNFIFVNFDDGDKPVAVLPFFDSILILKERSVFRITGVPPAITIEPVIFRQDLTSVGTFNQKAIVVDQNEALFPAQDGVYLVSRYEGVQQGFTSRRISRAIDRGWQEVNTLQGKKAHAVFFRERRQYRVYLPIGTEPERAYVYQFEGNVQGDPYGWSQWTFDEGGDGGIAVTASHVARGEPDVHYIGSDTGDVLRMDIGAAERGAFAYTFEYDTTFFAPAGKGMAARGRALDLALSVQADTTLTVEIEADFMGPQATVAVPIVSTAGFTLDNSVLDIDALGVSVLEQAVGIILHCLGEYHRIRFRELSATAIFAFQNWTYWFQSLPTLVKPRLVLENRM